MVRTAKKCIPFMLVHIAETTEKICSVESSSEKGPVLDRVGCFVSTESCYRWSGFCRTASFVESNLSDKITCDVACFLWLRWLWGVVRLFVTCGVGTKAAATTTVALFAEQNIDC